MLSGSLSPCQGNEALLLIHTSWLDLSQESEAPSLKHLVFSVAIQKQTDFQAKHSFSTGKSSGGMGVQEQRFRARIEREAWTAYFQKEVCGKCTISSFGWSHHHEKSHTDTEVLSSPEQKCSRQFKKGSIHKLSKLVFSLEATVKGYKHAGTDAEDDKL